MNGRFKTSLRLAIVLVLLLSLSLVTAAPVAAVTGVTVSVTPTTVNATATYHVSFTSAVNLTGAHWILIDFPAGANITAATATVNLNAQPVMPTVPPVAGRVAIDLNMTHVAGHISVIISGVINPTAAGTYTLGVSTTPHPAVVTSPAFTIHAGGITNIIITPTVATIVANATQAFTATARDAFNNTVTLVTGATSFSVTPVTAPPGLFSVVGNVVRAWGAGNYTVTGNYTGMTATATLVVTPGPVADLDVLVQPVPIQTAGTNITPAVVVNASDVFGNPVAVPIVASVNVTAVPIRGTPTVTSNITLGGNATFANLIVDRAGAYTLIFRPVGVPVAPNATSAAFTVGPAAPARLVVAPATATRVAGIPVINYTANSTDAFGNLVATGVAINVTVPAGAVATAVGNGTSNVTVNATRTGTWTITAFSGAINGTATLTITPAPAVNITVSPDGARVFTGDPVTFTSTASDAFGNTFAVTANTTWNISALARGFWVANVYTTERIGTWNVTGNLTGLTDIVTLVVQPTMCFIVTAAYGTPMAEEIQTFREFRDTYLLTNPVGRALVALYYEVSPPIAQLISEHPALQQIVRVMLVPALAMSTLAVNSPLATPIIILGLVLISLALAAWMTKRREGKGQMYA